MNKKGISLFELIGALVIFSIVVTLTAMIINFYVQANNRITLNSQANYEGNLVVRRLDDYFRDLSPTTFGTCPGVGCYTFSQEFTYELNPATQEVELVVHSIPVSLNVQVNAGNLYIGGIAYDFNLFSLNTGSSISVTQSAGVNSVDINLILEADDGTLFEFLFSYTFEELVIPDA